MSEELIFIITEGMVCKSKQGFENIRKNVSAGFSRFQERFIWSEIYTPECKKMKLRLSVRIICPGASLAKPQRSLLRI